MSNRSITFAANVIAAFTFLFPDGSVLRSAAQDSTAQDSAAPNVVLIVTDEHNFRTLGCYREQMPVEQAEMWGPGVVVPTPNIDALAGEGVICTRAYATAPVCSPCRAAMITGRYPHATGVPTNNHVLDRTIPTLADRLNDAGYRTSFIGKWHLGGDGKPEWAPKVDGGFKFKDFMFNRGHWKKFVFRDGKPAVGPTNNDGVPNYNVDGADKKTFSTDFLTDRAIEFAQESIDQKTPFFTVISYPDPHGPNTVRAPYDHRFDDLRYKAPRTYQTGIASPKWLSAIKKHPVFRGEDMSKYFGMVQCIDDNIGRLTKHLRESGQLDNTLILLTSDHGDLCYEHDRQNKGNPYEGSARVPMILRYPKSIRSGQVYEHPVGTVDVTPTIMGLLELAEDKDDQGRNLATTLMNVSAADIDPESPPVTFLRNSGTSAGWVAAVDARYKLILSVNDQPWLFDREQDPDELLNFYRRPGTEGVAERLANELREYGKRVNDPHLKHQRIADSLAAVLGEKVTKSASDDKTSSAKGTNGYRSDWKGNRRWIGPDWWANPMTDWNLRNNAAIASAAANRTLCLLPAEIGGQGDRFEIRVNIESLGVKNKRNATADKSPVTAAGFRIGRQGGIDDYRHTLIHATEWIDATIREDGRLALDGELSENSLTTKTKAAIDLTLRVSKSDGSNGDGHVRLELSASSGDQSVSLAATVPKNRISGGVSLVVDGAKGNGGVKSNRRYAFREFELSGESVSIHENRDFGPILWSQYALNRDQLRLQAQFAPLGPRQAHEAELWIAPTGTGPPSWIKVATEPMDKLSRTVTFKMDQWDATSPRPYQVRFDWRGRTYVWEGTIRNEPSGEAKLRLACFSCDNGYLFPIPSMVAQVAEQDPDMMFFAGDQIYESYGGFGVARDADVETAMLDYLRKFYQFGWTWRELMKDRPTVLLPDDHDVFQGNIWGHGGRKLPYESGKPDWTLGGYLMPGEWVSAVEKTNVGHLPDPADSTVLPIGIKPYYTKMTYGGVGFAILEDRKFKTGPKSMPEDQRVDGEGGDLLGAAQEAFLKSWANDWQDHEMKCVLSQTIFCNAATHTGYNLKRSRSYYDSGAWPKSARNRAVRIMGDCNALAIHGDQHLGVLLRHGVDDFDDAGYAFMVPGTANGFPRAWWPGEKTSQPEPGKNYTGKFRDDAGHPIHMLAVGNPEPGSNLIPKTASPAEIGRKKGSGYGLVEFDTSNGMARINLYRYGGSNEQFDGFPHEIRVGGRTTQ